MKKFILVFSLLLSSTQVFAQYDIGPGPIKFDLYFLADDAIKRGGEVLDSLEIRKIDGNTLLMNSPIPLSVQTPAGYPLTLNHQLGIEYYNQLDYTVLHGTGIDESSFRAKPYGRTSIVANTTTAYVESLFDYYVSRSLKTGKYAQSEYLASNNQALLRLEFDPNLITDVVGVLMEVKFSFTNGGSWGEIDYDLDQEVIASIPGESYIKAQYYPSEGKWKFSGSYATSSSYNEDLNDYVLNFTTLEEEMPDPDDNVYLYRPGLTNTVTKTFNVITLLRWGTSESKAFSMKTYTGKGNRRPLLSPNLLIDSNNNPLGDYDFNGRVRMTLTGAWLLPVY